MRKGCFDDSRRASMNVGQGHHIHAHVLQLCPQRPPPRALTSSINGNKRRKQARGSARLGSAPTLENLSFSARPPVNPPPPGCWGTMAESLGAF